MWLNAVLVLPVASGQQRLSLPRPLNWNFPPMSELLGAPPCLCLKEIAVSLMFCLVVVVAAASFLTMPFGDTS